MHRRLVVLALTAGCGSVQNSGPPDGTPPDGSIDLARGCALKAQMDEASWPTTGSPHVVIDKLGTTLPSYDSPVHVGCTPAPNSAMTQQTFQGELDNVTIWNRALSDAEITQLYANG